MYKIIKTKSYVKELVQTMLNEPQLIVSGIFEDSTNDYTPDKFWFAFWKTNTQTPIIYSWIRNGNYPIQPEELTIEETEEMIWKQRKEINNYTKRFFNQEWNK